MRHKFLFTLIRIFVISGMLLPLGGAAAQMLPPAGSTVRHTVSELMMTYLPIIQRAPYLPDPDRGLYIPAGYFQMGCDPQHNSGFECNLDETPLHTVYLDSYYIDAGEVTNAEYTACITAGACILPSLESSHTRETYFSDPNYAEYPVINVDWYRANAYCTWAGGSLPTEAQWEKAARGNRDTRPYPWGERDPDCSLLNFYDFDGSGFCVGDTAAVGSYPEGVSPYGGLDVAGNVWEWVSDWYAWDYYTTSPDTNPTGPTSGIYKVLRGGSYNYSDEAVRVAFRKYYDPQGEDYDVGFRCSYLP